MKTLIAIPCMDMIHTGFARSLLSMDKPGEVVCVLVQNTLIYNARNLIAQKAIEEGFDRVLWLDSDMVIPEDAMTILSDDMDKGMDFVSGLYFKRKPPYTPVIYNDVDWKVNDDGTVEVKAVPFEDYLKNQIFLIDGSGFGCCMTSISLLKDMVEKFGAPFTPLMGMGEDLAFCWRMGKAGYNLFCDSRVKCGHIGQYVYSEPEECNNDYCEL